jgi:hypothetical protein
MKPIKMINQFYQSLTALEIWSGLLFRCHTILEIVKIENDKSYTTYSIIYVNKQTKQNQRNKEANGIN